MFPTNERIEELRKRFDVHNGQFFGEYRFKNLNWYFTFEGNEEWFCYGDIREEDIERLRKLLGDGERLRLGWKELGPEQKKDGFFGDGGGLWLEIGPVAVMYDIREDVARRRRDV